MYFQGIPDDNEWCIFLIGKEDPYSEIIVGLVLDQGIVPAVSYKDSLYSTINVLGKAIVDACRTNQG